MNKEDVLAAVQQYIASAGDWLIASGLRILLILLLMVVALRAARVLARFLVKPLAAEDDIEFAKRRDTLSYVLTVALRVVVYVVSLMMILGELGINLGAIIATAGIASLAIGFGAQELVRDVISGFFILL
ncbi:MAG: mechanosensitive ion channel family protein, partial [Gammaproteobacteria bacterium]|nr:mechanosensitive ion channel family protein [Gammaproteobacteria bacterium]